jgi:hypothetical protein
MEKDFDDIVLSTDDDEEFQAGTHLEIFRDTSVDVLIREKDFDDIVFSTDDDEEFQAGTHLEIFSDTSVDALIRAVMSANNNALHGKLF